MTDEPFENAEAEIAQEDEEENDALVEDADDVPSEPNESHPNEDDIAEAREAAE